MTCNIPRNLASSSGARNPSAGRGPNGLRAANDSAAPRPSRISARKLDDLASRLTDHDEAVVLLLSELRLATGFQIARRLFGARVPSDSGAWAARRALRRLEDARVLDRLPRRVGGVRGGSTSLVFGLGPAGRRLLARLGYETKRLGTPGDRHVAHTLAITELVVRLHEATLAGELDVIEMQTEPSCWRGFLGAMGARFILKPDLFVRVGAGAFEDRWFIEVDLSTEARGTISGKAQRYLAHFRSGVEQHEHAVYPRVLWTVPNRRRAEQITDALASLPVAAQLLFVVWSYDEVVGRLSAEARG
jgi:hypothetical protein